MRAHKKNIEKRMQDEKVEDWSYWSQRRDSLKRYPKQESLDPSWYTDNIYSNQSLDLDGTDMMPDFEKFDRFLEQRNRGSHHSRKVNHIRDHLDANDNSDQFDDDDIFSLNSRAKHATGNLLQSRSSYKYPKSRSCCFGGGYETQKTVSLIPKSHTFSAGRSRFRDVRQMYDHRPRIDCCNNRLGRADDVVVERLTYRRSVGPTEDERERHLLENDFCYSRRHSERDRRDLQNVYYDGFAQEANTSRPEMSRMRNKADYIQNEWLNKSKTKSTFMGDRNGNVCEPPDDHLDELFDDHEMTPYEYNQYKQHRRRLSFDSDVDNFMSANDRVNLFEDINRLETEFEDAASGVDRDYYNYRRRRGAKSKRALEVKPPSRYDDSSSDSTDVELDDFNFDFEKYWDDLDKTNSVYDMDIQNNNTYNNLRRATKKVKNINVSRYNNSRCVRPQRTLSSDLQEEVLRNPHQHSDLLESLLAPSSDSSVVENHDCADGDSDSRIRTIPPINRYGHKVYPSERPIYNHFSDPTLPTYPPPPPPILKHPSPRNTVLLPLSAPANQSTSSTHQSYPPHMYSSCSSNPQGGGLHHHHHPGTAASTTTTTNPFSLIHNIFSIYKPKKYSPLNCNTNKFTTVNNHTATATTTATNNNSNNKIFRGSKKMNVASTIRPLGAPANDFITSLKRPLMVTPSPSVEQPHFKIIPEKTGLKISPLYRFDYDSGERKFMLRSTARPLMMFPH